MFIVSAIFNISQSVILLRQLSIFLIYIRVKFHIKLSDFTFYRILSIFYNLVYAHQMKIRISLSQL